MDNLSMTIMKQNADVQGAVLENLNPSTPQIREE